MTAQEITNTKSQLKEMIYSNELSNCVLACEIIKSLDWSDVEKLDFIKPILYAYHGLCSALANSSKALNQLDAIELMTKKVGIMNELIKSL